MTSRKITQVVSALEVTEGAGVSVFRSIGTLARRNLDPFLMLDQFSSDDPDDYIAGFPDHPHRGFNTFTYMLDGHMQHGDSMGNQGDLGPGGAQWMKAGSGVIHSETPQQKSGRMRGFQLWVNLPAEQKMTDPEYQEVRPKAIPELTLHGNVVRIVAGEMHGRTGPVSDPNTAFQYLDVSLQAGRDSYAYGTEPNDFLVESIGSLPKGKVLCLAEGEGRNAVWLAQQGREVTAMDASEVGLAKAQRLADARGVNITTVNADLAAFEIESQHWDAIV